MKDHEFIELLNLYLDHEISAVDAARLEEEIQRNPGRRKLYREYCRMQRACRILATEFTCASSMEQFAMERPSVAAGSTNIGGPGRWRQWVLGTSGLVAVASLGLVAYFGFGTSPGTESGTQARATLPGFRMANEDAVSGARPVAVAPTRVDGPGLTSTLMAETTAASSGSLVLSFSRSHSPDLRLVTHGEDQLEWVRRFQMVSLAERNRVSLPRFEETPQTLRPDIRAIRLGTPVQPAEEVAAFRFLK